MKFVFAMTAFKLSESKSCIELALTDSTHVSFLIWSVCNIYGPNYHSNNMLWYDGKYCCGMEFIMTSSQNCSGSGVICCGHVANMSANILPTWWKYMHWQHVCVLIWLIMNQNITKITVILKLSGFFCRTKTLEHHCDLETLWLFCPAY